MPATTPVLLNVLQMVTLEDIVKKASSDGVIEGSIIASYKQNVIGALMRRGIIKVYKTKHFKLTGVPVSLKPETVPRKPKVAEPVESDKAA